MSEGKGEESSNPRTDGQLYLRGRLPGTPMRNRVSDAINEEACPFISLTDVVINERTVGFRRSQ